MEKKVSISLSPVTRIEGHLSIHTETEALPGGEHRIVSARCEGEMFRGIEKILEGRDPLDAQQITQRICGICPISHAMASVLAQEMAYGIGPTHNGRLLQNLIWAANYIQSHILHFYHLVALDFVDVKAVLSYQGQDATLNSLRDWLKSALARNDEFAGAPFLPRCEGDFYIKDNAANWGLLLNYVKALQMRTRAHEMAAVFGAKLPHSTAIVPTGVTQAPTIERVLAYRSRLRELSEFIEHHYLPDLLAAAKAFPQYWDLGRSHGNFMSFGVFRMKDEAAPSDGLLFPAGALVGGRWERVDQEAITEDVANSRFSSGSGLHPFEGDTVPAPGKGYSWLKAPRYRGLPMEVGPLARVLVGYGAPGGEWMRADVDRTLGAAGVKLEQMHSVMGRHVARGLEAKWLAAQCERWLDEVELDQPAARDYPLPREGRGIGMTEAPRGALGHWLVIQDHKIQRYQCVVPTTWNCSPRDDRGQPGAVEKALEGTIVKDPAQPIEAGRVVRSFDPCLACAVH